LHAAQMTDPDLRRRTLDAASGYERIAAYLRREHAERQPARYRSVFEQIFRA
jgi:hypothetical protein